MTQKGSTSRGPSRRSPAPTAFEQEFPAASESANGTVIDVFRTYNDLIAVTNKAMAFLGLSATGRQALAVIEGAGEPLSPTEISKRLFVTTASTTSLLDTLEKLGLVTRMPDPHDRRKILVQITADGQRTVDGMLPKVVAVQTAAVAPLTEDERAQLRHALAIMRECIAELDVEAVTAAAPPRSKPKPKPKRKGRP